MPKTTATAQTLQNVAYLTAEIDKHEARTNWDGRTLSALYRRRHAEVLAALRQGATVEELAAITGLGA
jgi:hypothetical protein